MNFPKYTSSQMLAVCQDLRSSNGHKDQRFQQNCRTLDAGGKLLHWIKNLLVGILNVNAAQIISPFYVITNGIPQRLVLEPMLFLLVRTICQHWMKCNCSASPGLMKMLQLRRMIRKTWRCESCLRNLPNVPICRLGRKVQPWAAIFGVDLRLMNPEWPGVYGFF